MGRHHQQRLEGVKNFFQRNLTMRQLKRYIPIVGWLPQYRLAWIKNDVIAALTVGLTLIPQALALAQLANVPPQYGLYSSISCLIVYTLLGTSKDAGIGPTSLLCMMVGQFMMQLDTSDTTYTTLMALFTGLILSAAGFLRLGFLVNMFSIPVIVGFTNAAGLTIIAVQMKNVFGIPAEGDTAVSQFTSVLANFTKIHFADFGFAFSGMVFLLTIQRLPGFLSSRVPAYSRSPVLKEIVGILCGLRNVFLVVISATVSFALPLRYPWMHISTVSDVPSGIPMPTLPRFALYKWENVTDGNVTTLHETMTRTTSAIIRDISPSFVILPLMAALELVAVTKALARKNQYSVDHSQEFIAVGVANVIGSFFGGFPVTVAATRSALNDLCHVSTPLASSLTAVIVIIVTLVATPVLSFIPKGCLAAVIISAGLSLIDLATIVHVWKEWRWDIIPLAATFFVSIFFHLWQGILAGLAISLALLLAPAVRLKIITERMASTGSGDNSMDDSKEAPPPDYDAPSQVPISASKHHPELPCKLDDCGNRRRLPSHAANMQVVLVRLQQGLQYPSADRFTNLMSKILAREASAGEIHHVVIDCQFITGLDFTALQAIRQVLHLSARLNRPLYFARLKPDLRRHIESLDMSHFRHVTHWEDVIVTAGAVAAETANGDNANQHRQDVENGDIVDGSDGAMTRSTSFSTDSGLVMRNMTGKEAEELSMIAEEGVLSATIPHALPATPAMGATPVKKASVQSIHRLHVDQMPAPSVTPQHGAHCPLPYHGGAASALRELSYEPHFFGSEIPIAVGDIDVNSLAAVAEQTNMRRQSCPSHYRSQHNDGVVITVLEQSMSSESSAEDYDEESESDAPPKTARSRKNFGHHRELKGISASHHDIGLLEFVASPATVVVHNAASNGSARGLHRQISSEGKNLGAIGEPQSRHSRRSYDGAVIPKSGSNHQMNGSASSNVVGRSNFGRTTSPDRASYHFDSQMTLPNSLLAQLFKPLRARQVKLSGSSGAIAAGAASTNGSKSQQLSQLDIATKSQSSSRGSVAASSSTTTTDVHVGFNLPGVDNDAASIAAAVVVVHSSSDHKD